MQSTSNSNTLHSYFVAKKPELNQTNLTLLNNLEQLIKMPLQDLLLDEIVQDLEEFRRSCSGAREYLNKIRLESRDTKDQGKGESQSVLICRHLMQVLNTFLEETLGRVLSDWEKTLKKGAPSSARLDCTKMMIQITSVGLEMTFSGVTLVCAAVGKKQKIEEEVSSLVTLFRKLSETVLTRPSLMLLGEYQTMIGDSEQAGDGGKIIQTLERVYKEVWKLIFLLKKLNLFGDQADSLLNILEIALVQLIDSTEISHNVLGYEVAMTIFTLTDNEYYVSLINVVSSWNRKAQLNNIGKLYQILFLYANEQVRDKILCEVEGLEPIEMLRFLELFDTKMYEGFLEGGLLFQEGSNIIHNPNMLVDKLGLTKNLTLKLQRIMNERVYDELLKSTEVLKNEGYSQESPERRRYIALLKISSIAMNNTIFLKDGACAKLYDTLLLLTDEYLSNPEAHGTHYVQIQIMIDIVHGMHEMTSNTFEQIVDLTAKSENVDCQLFAAKFGNIIHNVTPGDVSQKTILEKVGGIYHNMLDSEDFLLKFKAVEGIMLAANNSTLGQEDLAVIVPPRDEDKDLLRKIANPSQEASKRVGTNISKEFIEVVGGRLASVQEDNDQMKEKFDKIKKDYPYELGIGGQDKDDEIEKAYKIFEETIRDLKETTLSPRAECRKLQLKNKMNALMNMLQG